MIDDGKKKDVNLKKKKKRSRVRIPIKTSAVIRNNRAEINVPMARARECVRGAAGRVVRRERTDSGGLFITSAKEYNGRRIDYCFIDGASMKRVSVSRIV
ncbi:hypothetical protein EVAR_100481_1 [Eumeta japonica]|uniref:Uncharacterized protein n=1 Tax=Eumeta variegata TaxID=151549 RepID=A0A4C2A7X9_EUMVA|nr:hypothetical protein EVAR_100481_1 [Eumeta japonica]